MLALEVRLPRVCIVSLRVERRPFSRSGRVEGDHLEGVVVEIERCCGVAECATTLGFFEVPQDLD